MAGGGDLKLHGLRVSPFVIRVRMALHMKGLSYDPTSTSSRTSTTRAGFSSPPTQWRGRCPCSSTTANQYSTSHPSCNISTRFGKPRGPPSFPRTLTSAPPLASGPPMLMTSCLLNTSTTRGPTAAARSGRSCSQPPRRRGHRRACPARSPTAAAELLLLAPDVRAPLPAVRPHGSHHRRAPSQRPGLAAGRRPHRLPDLFPRLAGDPRPHHHACAHGFYDLAGCAWPLPRQHGDAGDLHRELPQHPGTGRLAGARVLRPAQ
ncbi:hypothetical protein BRADI_3g31865v3 [Brachypodium distachyon]|uniref:GST N-terminal domain-containing protein n=1 Tax=Brachypodium distachyon TaxID=15368 RepID=A0A2K2D0F7_BRADI|nr:hypothetical protein BRADI_3g31865v3 [Brachypodium distachyon]